MSLKAFHVFFIGISTLLSVGFAGWCFVQFRSDRGGVYVVAAFVSFAAAFGLVAYGVRFTRKLKDVSYL